MAEMMNIVNIPFSRKIILRPANALVLVYTTLAVISLAGYLKFLSASFILAMIALPFVLKGLNNGSTSYRYGWLVLLCALLCFLMPVKTLLYFTICFSLVFFAESFYGKTGILVPAVILLASPVFQYLGSTFSFPIRLQLTTIAGKVFNMLGYDTSVQGNMIMHQGNEFAVDPACMGLNMMITSLLVGVILIAWYQQKFNTRPHTGRLILYLGVVLLLNIIANLFRVLLLVQFNILPGTVAHDIAGITCLITYVIIPTVYIAAYIARRSKPVNAETSAIHTVSSSKTVLLHSVIIVGIALLAYKVRSTDTFDRFSSSSQKNIEGYSVMAYAPGIVKLENDRSLIYVKHLRGFYDTDHNPMICWTGSGYLLGKIKEESIGGRRVFTAMLTRDNDKLYTAWWFDNGSNVTTDQVKWRWDMVKGSNHYAVVNISCTSKQILNEEIQKVFNKQTLSPFFIK